MTDNPETTTMEKINCAIKLTSTLNSELNEFLWGIDEVPDDLKHFLELFQSLGKVLSGFRNGCPGDQEFHSFVFQKLNAQNGPLSECVAELNQLHLRIKSDKGEDEGQTRLRWLLDKIQLCQYTLRIEKHKNILALALQLMKDQSKLSEIMAETYLQDTGREKVKSQSEPPTDSSDIASVESMKRRKSSLEWLFPGDFESRYLGIQERRIKDTGEWLLQSPTFRNWTNRSPGHTVLWGCAKAGAGKTFISAKVIDHIKSRARIHNSAIGYYFFDRMEQDQLSHKDILFSLIVQLALQERNSSAVPRTWYSRLVINDLDGKPKPSTEKLYINLIEILKCFDQVFFVFDGMDEYNQYENFLRKFVQNLAMVKMSVFVTSNSPPINLHSSLHAIARIDLSARAEDIKMSIEKWVDMSQQFRLRLESGKCQDRFIKEMTTCANGMLLFIDLGMRAVIQQPTVKCIFSLIEQLQSFAREGAPFSSIYAQCIRNIRRQDSVCSTMAMKILSWLVKAQRALTVNELREAISVKPKMYKLEDSDLPDAVTMVNICSGLVTIDQSSGVVRLIHDTARQYLQRYSVIPLDFDYQMAMACLTYLSFEVSRDSYQWRQVKEEHPFFDYAARYLSFHINNCDESLTTKAFLSFTKSSRQAALYLETFRDECLPETDTSPLAVAAQVGHLAVVRILLAANEHGDFEGVSRRTALHQAVIGHHYETVKLLLQELRDGRLAEYRDYVGASVVDDRGKTVLHWAARKGYKDIVELLVRVENKVDIMKSGRGQQTALHEAARGGHEELVKMFLEKGIPLWEREEYGRTALHEAAEGNHTAIVKLLLKYCGTLPAAKLEQYSEPMRINERDSNGEVRKSYDARLRNGVSAQDRELRTPLHLAASECHTEIVQLLLGEGADVFAKDTLGESVLHQAVRGGSKRIVELLVQVGADIGAANRNEETILHLAATRGYTDIVQILLDNAVDTSPRLYGRPALQLAIEEGHEGTARLLLDITPEGLSSDELDSILGLASERGYTEIVKVLLDLGANEIDAAFYIAATEGHLDIVKLLLDLGADEIDKALYIAASKGHLDIVKLLLDLGADEIDAALYIAATNGRLDIVKLLLGAGSDILSRHKDNETALHTAAYNGNVDLVKLLLANGADVRTLSSENQTPLHMAARNTLGNKEIIQLLLEASADVNAKDTSGKTALMLAASCGTVEDVRPLIVHGADVFGHDANGETALHTAAYLGKANIIKLLLDRGANISARNSKQETALLLAVERYSVDSVKLLLESGADLTESDASNRTPLLLAAGCQHGGEVVRLLIDSGADINERDAEGRTAYFVAVGGGCSEVVEVLLKNGASISERDKAGNTALFVASGKGNFNVVRVLLENGADVSETNEHGETALFLAWNSKVFGLLVEKGADPYLVNRDGETAYKDPDMFDDYDWYESPPRSVYGW